MQRQGFLAYTVYSNASCHSTELLMQMYSDYGGDDCGLYSPVYIRMYNIMVKFVLK